MMIHIWLLNSRTIKRSMVVRLGISLTRAVNQSCAYAIGYWALIGVFCFTAFNTHADPTTAPPNLEKAQQQALIEQHKSVLEDLIDDESLQQLLVSHQKSLRSLADIYDNEINWKKSKPLQRSVTDNSVARRFRALTQHPDYQIAELILTDGFGFNIAAWPLPSDYWQGDEAKFIEPMRKRKTHFTTMAWDESSQVYSFFVTHPLFINGQFYGVLIMGIAVKQ